MIELKRITVKPREYTYLGSTVLRGIQNNSTNTIDLLVRESIQNSLDAGLEGKDTIVDFSMNNFDSTQLLNILDGINIEKIQNEFKDQNQKQLVISDRNTTGLTGSLDVAKSSTSNIYKLIYSLGQPQEGEGSGGSWGYGKTIFYRVGIGLVMFYTRIKVGHGYEERLVFSLIENEKEKDKYAYYAKDFNSGISWWGEETYIDGERKSIPIKDSKKIHQILDLMNITPYFGDQTGTIISIPFINEERLIDFGNYNGQKYSYDGLLDYIKVSIQRWYSPRLNNDKYNLGKKNKLTSSINGIQIKENEIEEFFKLTREFYNYGIGNISKKEFNKYFPNVEIERHVINVRANDIEGLVGREIGYLSYAKIHYNDLKMIQPKSLNNPYNLINESHNYEHEENNSPIVLMTRQPGMIVKYDTSGRWSSGIPKSPREEFTVAFFVLNSSSEVYFDCLDDKITLEEYIRGSEKADHMDWSDRHIITKEQRAYLPNIIHRVTNNINRRIREKLFNKDNKGSQTSTTNHLQNLLGEKIMPPLGFGTRSTKNTVSKSTTPKPTKTKHITHSINYHLTKYDQNGIKIPFNIQVLNNDFKGLKIRVLIKTEAGLLSEANYRKITSKRSPIKFTRFLLEKNNIENLDYNIKDNELIIINNDFKEFDRLKGFIYLVIEDQNYIPEIRIEVIK